MNYGLQLLNPFWWLGFALGLFDSSGAIMSKTIFPSVDQGLAPEPVATQARTDFYTGMSHRVNEFGDLVDAARADCLGKAARLRVSDVVPMMLTGTFPAINILPGRQMQVYVPFERLAEYPRKLYLRVFDLVTSHDAAGLPTRRSSFSFELRRVDSPPSNPTADEGI